MLTAIKRPVLPATAWVNICVVCLIRLLGQLRDMEEAFDGFFEKHHLKLQQYLQLLQYELSFQQVWFLMPLSVWMMSSQLSLQLLSVCASRWRRC